MHESLGRIWSPAAIATAIASSAALAQPVLITAPLTIGPKDTTITSTDGSVTAPLETAEITVHGAWLTINGRHEIASLMVGENASGDYGLLTHDVQHVHDYAGDGSDVVNGMHLIVAGDLTIESGCFIGLSGRGYGFRTGPGAGVNNNCAGGGAGHGGGGGSGSGGCGGSAAGGTVYGSLYQPTDFGSGGNDDDNFNPRGGGVVRLEVAGTLQNEGEINSNGTDGLGARGAGGSIWIECTELAGSGSISANGGVANRSFNAGDGGGGGGGRIAIYSETYSFAGLIGAVSGGGHQPGGAGSIVLREGIGPRTVIYDNHGQSCINTVPVGGQVETDILIVRGNARLSHDVGNEDGLTVNAQEIIVEADGSIDVTGRGYGFREGPGRGYNNNCNGGGGGYGGFGGRGWNGCGGNTSGGTTYGIMQYPSDLGSGGASDDNHNPRAGGRITLDITDQLTVQGSIRSDGTDGLGGRGSGGAVLIFAGSVTGSGFISANGGDNTRSVRNGGGGGGGRVAVYACGGVGSEVEVNAFNGDGYQDGTPGTVFLALNEADLNGDRLLDLNDVVYFIDAFVNGYQPADLDRNGVVDLSDVNKLTSLFSSDCP